MSAEASTEAVPPSTREQFPFGSFVARALAGDAQAEREICRRLLPAVRAFAIRRLRPSSVEDFTHDVLLLLVEAMRSGRISEPERVAGFALGICRNLARERARSTTRRNRLASLFGVTEGEFVTWDREQDVRRDHLEDCYSQLADRARKGSAPRFVRSNRIAKLRTRCRSRKPTCASFAIAAWPPCAAVSRDPSPGCEHESRDG